MVYYASNKTSPVNRFQSTKYFGNGVAKGVYIKLCFIIQKIAKIWVSKIISQKKTSAYPQGPPARALEVPTL